MIPQLIAASAKLNIGLKKMKCSSYKWHPFGPVCIDDWEIEHVHYFAIEPIRIALAYWNEGSQCTMGTFTKNFSIEYTIDDVSDGTRQNQ